MRTTVLLCAAVAMASPAASQRICQLNPVRITNAPGRSYFPRLIWTGSEHGLFWSDEREPGGAKIYFNRLDRFGSRLAGDLAVTAAGARHHSAVWSGQSYGVAWRHQTELWYQVLDRNGAASFPPTLEHPTVVADWFSPGVWAADRFVFSFEGIDVSSNSEGLWSFQVDEAGGVLRNPWIVHQNVAMDWMAVPASHAVIARADELYYVWTNQSLQALLQRTDRSGNPTQLPITWVDTPDADGVCAVAAGDGEIAAPWTQRSTLGMVHSSLDPTGARVRADAELEPPGSYYITPACAWSGSATGMVDSDGPFRELSIASIEPASGTVLARCTLTAPGGAQVRFPDIAWDGSHFAIAWSDARHDTGDGNQEIYFARVYACVATVSPRLVASVCPGTAVTLDATSALDDCPGAAAYQWEAGATVLRPFDADPRFEVTPDVTTRYTVRVQCDGLTDCKASADVTVVVKDDALPPGQGNVLKAVRRDADVDLDFAGAPATAWRLYRDGDKTSIGLTAVAPDAEAPAFTDALAIERPGDDYYALRGLSPCSRQAGP